MIKGVTVALGLGFAAMVVTGCSPSLTRDKALEEFKWTA